MTNKVVQFIAAIPDEEIKIAVGELKDLSDTGILCDGLIRLFSLRLASKIGVSKADARHIIESGVLSRAAYAYSGLKYS